MILGLDKSANENNKTGYFYFNKKPIFGILHKNEEIFNLIENEKFKYIFTDAPSSYENPYREEERLLHKNGFKPLPLSFKYIKL
jgi:hypothetical protein